jgi:hypothetical protein
MRHNTDRVRRVRPFPEKSDRSAPPTIASMLLEWFRAAYIAVGKVAVHVGFIIRLFFSLARPAYPFPTIHSQSFMETDFLDRLANQLKANKGAACAVQSSGFWSVSRSTTRVANIAALPKQKASFEWLG